MVLEKLVFFITNLSYTFTLLFGFYVYYNNPRNLTHKIFLIFSILASLWVVFNYIIYKIEFISPEIFLPILRLFLFISALVSISFYFLFYIFPEEKKYISKAHFLMILSLGLLTGIVVLSPFALKGVHFLGKDQNPIVEQGWGMIIFAITNIFLNSAGIYFFIRNFLKAPSEKKIIFYVPLVGLLISIISIFLANIILPVFLTFVKLAIYGSFFILILVGSLAFSIIRYRILNIRIIAAGLYIFLLILVVSILFENVNSFERIIFYLGVSIIITFLGIFLTRTVMIEVEQREKLEQLNRIKSEFLSFASHQVRAPMAVVKGYAELIETQIENVPPQAKDFAHKIRESVNKLLELVEEFMDYRKIEEGKMELHFEEVDLVSLIKEFVNNFNLIAKEKNLELTFETSMEQCLVKVDKMKFSQVIQNLIDNAIKYTNQGWVKVNLQKEDNSVLITVADSGIGMSKELQQKLFGEFVRDPSIKREIRGTGLGLYIAKYIVEAHQGKIWAESEGENKGSKFYVKLPLN
jgi:signal transduction histidine kinase